MMEITIVFVNYNSVNAYLCLFHTACFYVIFEYVYRL